MEHELVLKEETLGKLMDLIQRNKEIEEAILSGQV